LIWRIRERSTFTRLSRDGQRSRAGVLWCTYVLDPVAMPPQVAYAIGRAYGPAVQRNRTRRQLRSLLDARSLPAGQYLFGVRPQAASRSSTELAVDLDLLISRIESSSSAGRRSSPA
jgi:ribonuclease P protein component